MAGPSKGQAVRLGLQAVSILISAVVFYELGFAKRDLPEVELVSSSWTELTALDGEVVYLDTTLSVVDLPIRDASDVQFALQAGINGTLALDALDRSSVMQVTDRLSDDAALDLSGAALLTAVDVGGQRRLDLNAAPETAKVAARATCTRALRGQEGAAYLLAFYRACLFGRGA